MLWNRRSNLAGTHAFLSASSPAWLRYDDDKLARVFHSNMAARLGTEMHALAHDLIRLNVKLPDVQKSLNMYVNDAIGYRMDSEVCLFYSENCYGHADAICFRDNQLRIHDYKSGVNDASFDQLLVYAALFCLEYRFKPMQIKTELRIYQNDEVKVLMAEPDDIFHVMDKIVTFDKFLRLLKESL